MGFKGPHKRHATIGVVVLPCTTFVILIVFIELGEGQRVDSYLIRPVAELGEDVGREHLRVAAGDIHIHIRDLHKPQHHIDEGQFGLWGIHIRVGHGQNKLYLIKKNVVTSLSVLYPLLHIAVELERIPVSGVVDFIQGKSNNLVFLYT